MFDEAPLAASRCLVIGAGEMGQAHLKVLQQLIPGRCAAFAKSERNRRRIEEMRGIFFTGLIEDAIAAFSPTHVVVASPVHTLASVTTEVLALGVRSLLVVKPAVLDVEEGQHIEQMARERQANVWVAYNRRFYSSILTAKRLVRECSEEISSVCVEFTEWSHVVEALENQAPITKARWVLANSMHVVDAAFHDVGLPDPSRSFMIRSQSLPWHPAGAIFVGAGLTQRDVPFSYCANWNAPGRWGFEWLTASTRYIFRPIEKLQIMRRGSVAIEEVQIDDRLDRLYKPGVYRQDEQFLLGDPQKLLVPINEALKLVELAKNISGYPCE